MNISYMIYQAERQRSAAEQREADIQAGQLAAGIAKSGRAIKARVIRLSGGGRPRTPVIPGDDLIPSAGARR
jgi:hypothetical protein